MATAVETSSTPRVPSRPTSLVLASVAGAVYVVAALAVVFYAVPGMWAEYVAPAIPGGLGDIPLALQVLTQLAAAVGLVWFGQTLAGPNPARGLRGGIFLVITAACFVFFVTRAVGLWAESQFATAVAQAVTAGVGVVLLVILARLLTSPRGTRWMVGLEEQGWFHLSPFKRALGQRVRRLTMLGIILVGATGVYALIYQGMIPERWTLAIPFLGDGGDAPRTVTVLDAARYAVPVLLIAGTVWVAYRATNVPAFAEFLIATEAEMNKVSWSSRKRLLQDTVVVLVTTILMAIFLLIMDLFWGWLLTAVDVLPGKGTGKDKDAPGQVREAQW